MEPTDADRELLRKLAITMDICPWPDPLELIAAQLRADNARLKAERATVICHLQEAQADAMVDVTDGKAELWREVASWFQRLNDVYVNTAAKLTAAEATVAQLRKLVAAKDEALRQCGFSIQADMPQEVGPRVREALALTPADLASKVLVDRSEWEMAKLDRRDLDAALQPTPPAVSGERGQP